MIFINKKEVYFLVRSVLPVKNHCIPIFRFITKVSWCKWQCFRTRTEKTALITVQNQLGHFQQAAFYHVVSTLDLEQCIRVTYSQTHEFFLDLLLLLRMSFNQIFLLESWSFPSEPALTWISTKYVTK